MNLRLSRREFVRQAAGWMAANTALTAAARAAETPHLTGPLVDVHTHLGQTWNHTQPLGAEELLRWMDAHQIEQAVVLPLVSPESSSYPLTTDFVLAQTAPYRDRLVPFCSVDPRTSYSGGLKGLVAMLRRYQDAGARGFGEHKPGVAVDDPRNMTIYAACAEVGLPLLFHLDEQRNTDVAGLPGLERALSAHPGCKFIGHGPGWWASISGDVTTAGLGGYPKTPVAPGGAMDRLMEKYPNLFADLSAGSGANAISRDYSFGREFLIRRADRVMFGSDFLAPSQAVPQFEVLAKCNLPPDVIAKIGHQNARTLFGLAGG